MDGQQSLRDSTERGKFSRRASQYSILQPQFKHVSRMDNIQDYRRVTPYDDPIHDVPTDDDIGDYGETFDLFNQELLLQNYNDRQRQAEQGRARLTLAPAPLQIFERQALSQPQLARVSREIDEYNTRERHHVRSMRTVHEQPSQFAYNDTRPQGPSSDVQIGLSSSPALQAGRRRAEQSTINSDNFRPGLRIFQNEQPKFISTLEDDVAYPILDSTNTTIDRNVMRQQGQDVPHARQVVLSPEQPNRKSVDSMCTTPLVQGIRLVPITALPDRLRTVFPFPNFNAVQSKCFNKVFKSNYNFVLASPTGSGKTAIFELAICRAVIANPNSQYKIVYQAPTKALCSERQRDWETKFHQIGLKSVELTGDSDAGDLRNVQTADIIITTPEKWDSVTRRWKDHEKLMRLIKLFLIDEVHILKEDRGAVLETVVSRMKSIGTEVRFLALSATVPNFNDVATWLGKGPSEPYEPAMHEMFGEEFRPVQLRKHVCGYVSNNGNDFAFDKALDSKLPEVILKYSEQKPIMIFCATRNSTVSTAKVITKWWISQPNSNRMWKAPQKPLTVLNKDLRDTLASGVAFHHAGLDLDDRIRVEKAFLNGEVSVICCTSTLAVGVNLPCHFVIIKNTITFTAEGLQEYSDLEMMQMLGRAGRPQFENSAVAVIMTRQAKVRRYEMMVSGQQRLESKLHLNLIDHVNAEIGLGTIHDMLSARKWLTGTFLYVRLQQNPEHYKLDCARIGQSIQEQVDEICFRDITLLRDNNLISGQEYFQTTEFGQAMARYYVHFETMKIFMSLQSKAPPSEIASAIAQATEFSMIRFRQGEKQFYKVLNKSPSIRWPIQVNLGLPSQKVSLIIQSILGSADIIWEGEMGKYRSQYVMEAQMIFKAIHSLIRCIIDCQVCLGDSISIHSALLLERSLGSQAWDDSPLQMKQIEGIGVVAVRKLVNAGIRSIEELEACESYRIESLIGRNPPFGLHILQKVNLFPKLRVSLRANPSSTTKVQNGVKIQTKVDIGFINDKPPLRFGSKLVYICLLVETSDGRMVHFARISGSKLGSGQSLSLSAFLKSPDQSINCYVMCDGIAGSLRAATVKPQIASTMFPASGSAEPDMPHQSNMSRRRIESAEMGRKRSGTSEDFGDDGIGDDELVQASFDHLDFDHIDNYIDPADNITRKYPIKKKPVTEKRIARETKKSQAKGADAEGEVYKPVQLANGKWACNHKCKDKNACRHLCCKEGTENPPKKPASAAKRVVEGHGGADQKGKSESHRVKDTQTKLCLSKLKRKAPTPIEELDLTEQEHKERPLHGAQSIKDLHGLHHLHQTIQGKDMPSPLHSLVHKKPTYCYSQGGAHKLSFIDQLTEDCSQSSSDYGDIQFDETIIHDSEPPKILPQEYGFHQTREPHHYADDSANAPSPFRGSDKFGDDDSLLADAIVGLVDSQDLQTMNRENGGAKQISDCANDVENELGHEYGDFPNDLEAGPCETANTSRSNKPTSPTVQPLHETCFQGRQSLFVSSRSSSRALQLDDSPQNTTVESPEPARLQQRTLAPPILQENPSNKEPEKQGNGVFMLEDHSDKPPAEIATAEEKLVPKAFQDLEPWLFQEFGDVVELVDE